MSRSDLHLCLSFHRSNDLAYFFYSQIIPLLSNYTQDFQNIYTPYFSCVYVQSCPAVCDSVDCSRRAPLSLKFSRQESWSGLPLPPQGNLPKPRIQPISVASPALAGRFFSLPLLGSPGSSIKPAESISCLISSDSLGPYGL